MPKTRRKVEVDPELLRKYLDLLERIRESDRKTATALADLEWVRKRIRELAAR